MLPYKLAISKRPGGRVGYFKVNHIILVSQQLCHCSLRKNVFNVFHTTMKDIAKTEMRTDLHGNSLSTTAMLSAQHTLDAGTIVNLQMWRESNPLNDTNVSIGK